MGAEKAFRTAFLRYFRATAMILEAHQAHLVGQVQRELDLYRQALAVNPADRDAVYLTERMRRFGRGQPLDF